MKPNREDQSAFIRDAIAQLSGAGAAAAADLLVRLVELLGLLRLHLVAATGTVRETLSTFLRGRSDVRTLTTEALETCATETAAAARALLAPEALPALALAADGDDRDDADDHSAREAIERFLERRSSLEALAEAIDELDPGGREAARATLGRVDAEARRVLACLAWANDLRRPVAEALRDAAPALAERLWWWTGRIDCEPARLLAHDEARADPALADHLASCDDCRRDLRMLRAVEAVFAPPEEDDSAPAPMRAADHPSALELGDYLAERLSERARVQLEDHVEACDDCRTRLASLERDVAIARDAAAVVRAQLGLRRSPAATDERPPGDPFALRGRLGGIRQGIVYTYAASPAAHGAASGWTLRLRGLGEERQVAQAADETWATSPRERTTEPSLGAGAVLLDDPVGGLTVSAVEVWYAPAGPQRPGERFAPGEAYSRLAVTLAAHDDNPTPVTDVRVLDARGDDAVLDPVVEHRLVRTVVVAADHGQELRLVRGDTVLLTIRVERGRA